MNYIINKTIINVIILIITLNMVCTLSGTVNQEKRTIPLIHVNVQSSVLNSLESTLVTQVFENNTGDTISEVKYNFSLIPAATITGLTSKFTSGKILKGIFSEKNTARETYEDAKTNNKVTQLLEKNYDGSYTILIGNFEKDSGIEILINYVSVIKDNTFIFPTNIFPKYMPKLDETDGILRPIQTTYSQQIPYTFNISVDWTTCEKIVNVEVVNNTNTVVIDRPTDSHAFININSVPSNGDIVIKLNSELLGLSSVYSYQNDENTYLGIFKSVPDVQVSTSRSSLQREIIFLLDRSGSMEGTPIDDAKKALLLFLNSLPENCTFNVISFGSTFTPLFKTPQKYNNNNLSSARSQISNFSADMGGTELYGAFDYAIGQSIDSETERVLILLTDGSVGHSDTYLSKYKQCPNLRLFCIGIGSGVNHQILQKISDKLNGMCDVISNSKNASASVTKFLTMLQKDIIRVTSISGNFTSETKQLERYQLSQQESYFVGQQFISFIKINNNEYKHLKNLEIIFKSNDGASYSVIINLSDILHCDNKLEKFYASSYVEAIKDFDRKNAVSVSVSAGIVNEFSSLILVDENTIVQQSQSPTPVEIPHSFRNENFASNGLMLQNQSFSLESCCIGGFDYKCATSKKPERYSITSRSVGRDIKQSLTTAKNAVGNMFSNIKTALIPSRGDEQPYVPTTLLHLQNVDGSFQINDSVFLRLIEKTTGDVITLATEKKISKQQATYILLLNFLASKPEYDLIYAKTKKYYESKFSSSCTISSSA